MTRFLEWWAAAGWPKLEGPSPEDAPMIEADDIMAWNFYGRSATAFVRDFGLMEKRLADLGITGVAEKDIFIDKLTAIHDSIMERDMAKAKKEAGGEAPAVTIRGSENG